MASSRSGPSLGVLVSSPINPKVGNLSLSLAPLVFCGKFGSRYYKAVFSCEISSRIVRIWFSLLTSWSLSLFCCFSLGSGEKSRVFGFVRFSNLSHRTELNECDDFLGKFD